MTHFFTLCMLIALSTLSSAALGATRRTASYAIVIGNNRADAHQKPNLRYADDDAVATHRLLLEAGVQSVLLTRLDADSRGLHGSVPRGGPPRMSDVKRVFSEFSAKMRAAGERGQVTEFYFFYSGHGDVVEGEGYVVLEDQHLKRSQLFDLLSRSPASTNHVFIDACKSYFLVFDRGPGGRRSAYTGPQIVKSVPARLDNTGFVLSTSSDRDSHEWERYQGGILSHELRSALRGAADVDLDGHIDYAELGAFLTTANRSIRNPRFRPDFLVRPPGQDLERVVFAWPGHKASLQFPGGSWGHFYVETAQGVRLLDAHPAPGQPLALWTPSERPLFVRANSGRTEYVIRSSEPTNVAEIVPSSPEVAARGAVNLALEQLFKSPFSDTDVRHFLASVPPEDALAEQQTQQSSMRQRVRLTTGGVAIVSEVLGLALNGVAAYLYLKGDDASQRETQQLNERVRSLNRASLPFHASAALAGIGFGLASWWPEAKATAGPASVQLGGTF